MSAVIFDVYFRRYGVKTPQYLMSPIISNLERWSFPKNSIHHYVVYDNVSVGPAMDEYIYRDITKKIFVEHAVALGDSKGNPRKLSIPLLPRIREYHIRNKRFRMSDDVVTTVRDENTLAVINYGFMTKAYRYIRSFYTEYFKWWNIEKTLWMKVAETAATSPRNQFIFVNLPKTLPPVTKLNAYSKIFNQQFIKTFNTGEYLFLLEVWKWLSIDNRSVSVIGDLPQESYNKINIVFQDSGKFILVNLGVLNSWRHDKDNPLPDQKIKIDPPALQKRFLRMLMTLMEARVVAPEEVEETDEELDQDEFTDEVKRPTTVKDYIANSTNPTIDKINNRIPDKEVIDSLKALDDDDTVEAVETKLSIAAKMLESMEKDLEALELIEKQRLDSIVIDDETTEKKINEQVYFKDKSIDFSFFDIDKSIEQTIEEVCADLADDGLMSAAEYRRTIKNADNYKNIISPDGKTPLSEFIDIDPADLKIESSATTVDRSTIVDKTMLKSSLLDFDEKYIKKVMSKDIVSMGVAIQKAGIIINKYEVEDVEDILGKYQMHSIRVSPINGTNSTLRFRVPVVNEDGTYMSNGINYRMRKQRGDKRPLFYE